MIDKIARRQWLAGALGGLVTSACASKQKPVRSSSGTGTGVTEGLCPGRVATAAGITYMLDVFPQDFWKHPVLGPHVIRYVPPERRLIAKRLFGFDLVKVREALLVGYGKTKLWVVQGVEQPGQVERCFRRRLREIVAGKQVAPGCKWFEGRTMQGELEGFASLGPGMVALETGGAVHVGAACMYALGKLGKVPSVDGSELVGETTRHLGEAPLVAVAWGPFEGEWSKALSGMLAAATSVGAAVRVAPSGDLAVRLVILGGWGTQADEAGRWLAASWKKLAASSLGHLLGLSKPRLAPAVEVQADVLRMDVVLDGPRLLDGLYKVVRGSIEDILRDHGSRNG